MKTITAYSSVDGTIYMSEKSAIDADENCIGEAIDALLSGAVAACNGNVTRNDQYRMSLYLMEHRVELSKHISLLNMYLNDNEELPE